MIPAFDSVTGFLPPGVHDATWEEFKDRFGYTQQRRDLISGLFKAVLDLRSCDCQIIFADGGFTTLKDLPPKDIDLCWDRNGVDLAKLYKEHPVFFDFSNGREKQKDKYGCEFFPADYIELDSGKPFLEYFQESRDKKPKGIIRIKTNTIWLGQKNN